MNNAYAYSVLERDAREVGAPYLVKPILRAVLLGVVEEVIGQLSEGPKRTRRRA